MRCALPPLARPSAIALAASLAATAAAQTPSFTLLPDDIRGLIALSDDGTVAAGMDILPWRWTAATGRVNYDVPGVVLSRLSGDGNMLIGSKFVYQGGGLRIYHPYRIRADGAAEVLWGYPLGPSWPFLSGVSDDGSVIVGPSMNGGFQGPSWVWTEQAGVSHLPVPWGNLGASVDVSGDGSTIAGTVQLSMSRAYTVVGGQLTYLETLPSHEPWAAARAVNQDGRVIVGASGFTSPAESRAVVWRDGVISTLDVTIGTATFTRAYDVSDDGSVVLGEVTLASGDRGEYIWAPDGDMFLIDYLLTHGVPIPEYSRFYFNCMSGDGKSFGGSILVDGSTVSQGWIATIPSPAGALPLAVAALAGPIGRRRRA